jgi:hypothetical protein
MTEIEFKLMKDTLNELIRQHNGLVKKVDECIDSINSINQLLFESMGAPETLDS